MRAMLQRLVTAFIILALMPSLALGCSGTGGGESWARIREEGILRVGLDPTYPPFESVEGTNVQGMDVDLALAVANELGLETHFVYFGYDGLYDALATGQVDVLASALVVQDDKMRDFAYSEPYYNAGQILLVRSGNPEIADVEDLAGQTVAVELGAEGHVVATELQRRLDQLEIAPHETSAMAMTSVANGEAAAALVDSISGRLFLKEEGGLEIAGDPVTVEPFAMVVRKEDGRLLQELNAALMKLEERNELARIERQWLGGGE
jgi:polar amino acid transport system substrate-binding protein